MANSQQLDILRRGAAAWNAWRTENPAVKVDLSHANLVAEDLREANLEDADLTGTHLAGAFLDRAQLQGAVLKNAKLFRAHLGGANLREADLQGADLGGAHLGGADLRGANLCGALLRGVNFYGALLENANLSGAAVGRTIFSNVDLSSVNGLEHVTHVEHSTVGLDSYFKSNDRIPHAFLAGTGLSQPAIDYLARFAHPATVPGGDPK